MKQSRLSIALLMLVFIFMSCEKSDDMDNVAVNVDSVKATASSGIWMVTLFEEDGVNETNDFSGFDFDFNPDGTITAINGDTTITGSWSITTDDNEDDDSKDDDIDFNIFFASPSNFSELTEDWDIVSYNDSRIELKDISGGDGSVDRLIFER
ncbi:MAG: hypothetical protein WBB24_14535 [Maribacter sp.]